VQQFGALISGHSGEQQRMGGVGTGEMVLMVSVYSIAKSTMAAPSRGDPSLRGAGASVEPRSQRDRTL